jgi:hypothetical protein
MREDLRLLTVFEKLVAGIAAVLAVGITAIVGGYWWSNSIPSRPLAVPANAVFFRAPATGAPGAPRGQWLACWEGGGKDRCRVSAKNGDTEFEDDFAPYPRGAAVPNGQLRIDVRQRSKTQLTWLGNGWVPLIQLEDGTLLIPESRYEEGMRIIERERIRTR